MLASPWGEAGDGVDNKIIYFVSCVLFFAATPLDRRKPYWWGGMFFQERSLTMIDNLMIGLKITGLGMGIVFSILIVLYIAIKILGRFAK